MRLINHIFGMTGYLLFNAVFVYFAGFLSNFQVPRSIDTPPTGMSVPLALAVDGGLLLIFAIHHSVAARPFFKKWLTGTVPFHLERSIYVIISSLLLAFVMWGWQPIPVELWRVDQPVLVTLIDGLFLVGLVVSLVATFQTDHSDLLGLRQIHFYLRNQPYTPPPFQEKGLYRVVRHPIMLGTLIVLWSTPSLTLGRLVFASILSSYIFVGIFLEERDLSATLGESYDHYRKKIPKIIPWIKWHR